MSEAPAEAEAVGLAAHAMDIALRDADFIYSPVALVDFYLVTAAADGEASMRIGVHKVFLIRYSKFFATLLAEAPSDEVEVTETASHIRTHLLDMMYNPSGTVIAPEQVLSVLALADKYQAPSVINSCGAVMGSPAFKLAPFAEWYTPSSEQPLFRYPPCPLEAMCIAGRHSCHGLTHRAVKALLDAIDVDRYLDVLNMMTAWGGRMHAALGSSTLWDVWLLVAKEIGWVHRDEAKCDQEDEEDRTRDAVEDAVHREEKKYASLLRKYNQLLGRAKKLGWA